MQQTCTSRTPLRCWQYKPDADVPVWALAYLKMQGSSLRFIRGTDSYPFTAFSWLVEFYQENVELFSDVSFRQDFALTPEPVPFQPAPSPIEALMGKPV